MSPPRGRRRFADRTEPLEASTLREDDSFNLERVLNEMRRGATAWPSTHRKVFEEAIDKLREALEEVQGTEEELRRQNEELAAAQLEAVIARERYAELFDFAPAAHLVTDLEGGILEANMQAAALLGVPHEELFGKPLPGFVPASERRAFRGRLAEITAEGQVHEWTLRLKPRDAPAFDAAVTVGVFRDADGKRAELRWIAQDVTERIQAQQDARRVHDVAVARHRKLQGITDVLLRHLELDDLLRELLEAVREAVGSDTATLLLPTSDGNNLAIRAAVGEEEGVIGEIRVPLGKGVAGRIAAERRPRIVPNLRKARPYSEFLRRKLHSLVGVPLFVSQDVVGVVHAGNFESHEFTEEDVLLLQLASERAAVAIENARLYAAEREARHIAERAANQTAALQAITTALSEALTTQQVATVVMERAMPTLGAVAGLMALITKDGHSLEIAQASGFPDRMLQAWRRFSLDAPLPLSEAVRTGRPVLLETVADREARYPHLGTTLNLPEHAVVAIPMSIEGRPLGGLVFRFEAPRSFDDTEVEFMLAMGRHAALALERARLYEAEQQTRNQAELAQVRLAFLAEASEALSSSLDYDVLLQRIATLAVPRLADWCLVDVLGSDGSLRQLALAHRDPSKEPLIRELRDRYPPEKELLHPVWKVLLSGEPLLAGQVTEEELAGRARDGEHLRLLLELGIRSHIVVPLTARGRILGALSFISGESDRRYGREDLILAQDLGRRAGIAVDNSQLYQAELAARQEAERAQARVEFLSEATASLSAAVPDYVATLERVAKLAVPALADICVIDVLDDDGSIRRIAVAHADPGQRELVQGLRSLPPDSTRPNPVLTVLRTGRPVVMAHVSSQMMGEVSLNEEHLALLRATRASALMILPLIARQRTLGTISLVSTSPTRTYGAEEATLAEELARRAALVVDNARLYERQLHIARTLQRSLLPPSIPRIPGMELAARYRAAGEGNEVGGDFYDAFEASDGAWILTIGDVCGKGPEAAAVTGLARHTIRAVSIHEARPSRVLATLNEAIIRELSDERFCTVCCVRLRPGPHGARLTICSGGHPLPLILRADGSVETAGKPSMLLGVLPEVELTDHLVDLGPGDTIVMITDGVVEEIRGSDRSGPERLNDVLAECRGLSAAAVADAIEDSLLRFGPEAPRDDIAILVLRVATSGSAPGFPNAG